MPSTGQTRPGVGRVWAIVVGAIGAIAAVVGVFSQLESIGRFSCRFYAALPYCKVFAEEDAKKVDPRAVLAERVAKGEMTMEQAEEAAKFIAKVFPVEGAGSDADRAAAEALARSSNPAVRAALEALRKGEPGAITELDEAVRAQNDAETERAFGQIAYPLDASSGTPSPLAQIEAALQPATRATMTMVDLAGAPLPNARAADGAYFRISVQAPIAGKALLLERTVTGKVVVLSPGPEISPPGGDKLKEGGGNRFPVSNAYSFRAEVAPPRVQERGRYVLVVVPETLNVEAMREILSDPQGADTKSATFGGLQQLAAYLQQEVPKAPASWGVSTLDYEFVKPN